MNLIQLQRVSVDALLSAPVNGRRASSFGYTVLNRKARSVASIRLNFVRLATRMGYTQEQVAWQWRDVCDLAILEEGAL